MTCCTQQQQPHLKSSLDTDKRLGLTLKPPDHKHQKPENLFTQKPSYTTLRAKTVMAQKTACCSQLLSRA